MTDDLPDWLNPGACAASYRARAEEIELHYTDQGLPVPPRVQKAIAMFLDTAARYESIAQRRSERAQAEEAPEKPCQPHGQVPQAPEPAQQEARRLAVVRGGGDDDDAGERELDDEVLMTMLQIPSGTQVRYWPVRKESGELMGEPFETRTRSDPFRAHSGEIVVFLERKAGYVYVEHLEVLEVKAEPLPSEPSEPREQDPPEVLDLAAPDGETAKAMSSRDLVAALRAPKRPSKRRSGRRRKHSDKERGDG